ncbi:MAG: hypothetical protein JW731_16550 [Bacteroidales bacterium]|nr:hypothetical protein [Bacteroidales bacterium]
MKFKIAVSILTVAIIGLFVTALYLSSKLVIAKNDAIDAKNKLNVINTRLQKTSDSLASTNEELEKVMKRLNVYEKGDQLKREKQLERGKYNLGIDVQADNKNYQDLIAFAVTAGFEIKYINQQRRDISEEPVIYYYSDADSTRRVAEQLKNDLIAEFDNLDEINIERGRSSEPPTTITAKLRFNFQ